MGLFCKGFTILHTNQNSPSKAGKTPEESGRILFWHEATGSNLFDMNLLRRKRLLWNAHLCVFSSFRRRLTCVSVYVRGSRLS